MGAGVDCCEAMRRRKEREHMPYRGEMLAVYRPLVWSAFGREHPETGVVLENLARAAARRRGLQDHRQLLRKVRAAVGVHLVCGAVRMAKATLQPDAADLPSVGGPELRVVRLLNGEADVAGPGGD